MSGCTYDGKEYSEGAILCIAGRTLECRGDAWMDIGPCSQQLDEIPLISDEEAAKSVSDSSKRPPQTFAEYTVFAEFFSIRRDTRYLYFRAAPTPGHLCANSEWVRDYRVPLGDVLSIGQRTACVQPPTTGYRQIRFMWPT
jgi:hypothetical protein